jgi:hypothetical protein
VNTSNGMAYVGSSVNIEQRWNGRRSALRKGVSENKALQAAWSAVQGAGFEILVLETTSADNATLIEAEDRWIATFRTTSAGVYNYREARIGRYGGVYNRSRTRQGWDWSPSGKRAHYFVKSTVSLCKLVRLKYESTFLEDFNHDSPANCLGCQKRRVLLPQPKKPKRRAPARPSASTEDREG